MSLFKAMKVIQSKGEATVPSIASKFSVSQSTADNWLRRGVDRGLLKANRPKPGEFQDVKGTVGRPAVTYTLTAKGTKALEAGEIPGGDRSGYRMEAATKAPRKSKGKSKAPKASRTSKRPRKAAKAPEEAPKAKGRKPLTEAQREAKRAKDRARRAKAKGQAAPQEAAAAE